MKDLDDIRKEINEIDENMRELFVRRLAVAAEVAEAKRASGTPILNPAREREILARVAKEVGAHSKKPVLLKRGMSATLQELLMSAEYVMASGNPNVMLCERGIRTYETATRNTIDLTVIPVLHRLTHLPVIVDPSHSTGVARLVEPCAMGAVVMGADGLIIEVHNDPPHALCDGAQSQTPEMFADTMRRIAAIRPLAYELHD